MCQVRLDDYHGAQTSFLNAIRFDPDNKTYLKNLHELMGTYLNDDTGKTEPPVLVTRELPGSDILRFLRDALCLGIGCILLIVYATLLLLDMAAKYPTIHIIGICVFINLLMVCTVVNRLWLDLFSVVWAELIPLELWTFTNEFRDWTHSE